MEPKITVSIIDSKHMYCSCCNTIKKHDKLYEITFQWTASMSQAIVLCEDHLDELRKAAFCAQTGLK
jgi:hypothetical protein